MDKGTFQTMSLGLLAVLALLVAGSVTLTALHDPIPQFLESAATTIIGGLIGILIRPGEGSLVNAGPVQSPPGDHRA